MPKFQITLPSGENLAQELADQSITVGRLSDNDLEINDVSVSSHHGELTLKEDGDYLLKDLGSTNGTKVNGEKGTEWELQDGDVVMFGKVPAVYSSEIPATKHSLPESEERTVELADHSHRPSDFTNASRFKSKSKKKDTATLAIVGFAVVAVLVFLGSLVMIFSLQPPV